MSSRVETYGRAFGDPEKGAAGQALSTLQARKLREIAGKAAGEATAPGPQRRSGFRRSPPPSPEPKE